MPMCHLTAVLALSSGKNNNKTDQMAKNTMTLTDIIKQSPYLQNFIPEIKTVPTLWKNIFTPFRLSLKYTG